jgi:hypothetical protein
MGIPDIQKSGVLTRSEKLIAHELIKLSVNDKTTTYKELREVLKETYGIAISVRGFGAPLGNIIQLCVKLNLPLLSVRIVYSGIRSKNKVASGFYYQACHLIPEYSNLHKHCIFKLKKRKLSPRIFFGNFKDFIYL